ncbi:MAG: dephospho-CoA kinase [Candidatus Marinimicrobia bacterium]|nr:dephospho-CoA kinase [Candidatus Neomarinimicrobiota bacterium]MBL7046988.1 dephospho-CoA kinase [Candidatus Neomarinimicrobiota bacterium]
MLKVGVTGGIGSGKSAVSKRLAELGAYVFDADWEAKKILDENETVQEQLIQEFGTDIQNPDGTINRKKLARKGFSNEENQAILNAIIHPFVFDAIDEVYEKLKKTKKHPIFVVDAALIYESGLDQHLDYVITVIAQYGLRLKRAMSRSNLTREEVVKRMDLQLPDNTKVQMADFIIDNNESEEKLYKQVDEVFHQLA